MYGHNPGHQPHHYAYGHGPYAHPGARTSGVGPMRGGRWPDNETGLAKRGPWPTSTGLSLDGVKTWLGESSLGVQHKWWALGIGALTVGALVFHGRQKRWF